MTNEEILVQVQQFGFLEDRTFCEMFDFIKHNREYGARIKGREWFYGSDVIRCQSQFVTDSNGVEHVQTVVVFHDPNFDGIAGSAQYLPSQLDLFSNQWVVFKLEQ